MKIAILGLGTVGSGVVNLLAENRAEIKKRTGENIEIIGAAVRDLKKPRDPIAEKIPLTDDPFSLVDDKRVEVVVELIGGEGAAKELMMRAIDQKKHVITANKALIAKAGNEIIARAQKNRVHILFEAAVAGGIPIIKALEHGLSANKITSICGIINGTSNFILSEMQKRKGDFSEILKEAQTLGYAEADPSFDIDGIDAAHKLAILSAMAFGTELRFDEIFTEGIRGMTVQDMIFADEFGYVIKHLGIAKKNDDQTELRVHPTLIPKTSMLAHVDGVMNAVMMTGNMVGDTLYYGPGAGGAATASAVVADLIDLIRGSATHDTLGWKTRETTKNKNIDAVKSAFYLRLVADDKPGILAEITSRLAAHNISIEAAIQKPTDEHKNAHIALMTNQIETHQVRHAVAEISNYDFIREPIQVIRAEV